MKLAGVKKEFPHGTRARYVSRCRCEPCTLANREYAREQARRARRGDGNPIIPADEVREHLQKLSRQGVGYKTVADAACVGKSIVLQVSIGRRANIRRQSALRILAVTAEAASDAKLVSAARTWRRINWLLEEGFTRRRISKLIGNNGRALQINREQVTLKTQARIERLVRRFSV